ncbi:hypothetical protein EJ08DRAFT_656385 [Tothia fuscella]|uniref:Uncharacterized protein n=1 Tax=Tothia fuscella TaxID=1048955 RepID=A0A9P4P2D3_9PEZI|nr:hypothetical protein EJ08DRAFT_656385 [Tothia fuscella]
MAARKPSNASNKSATSKSSRKNSTTSAKSRKSSKSSGMSLRDGKVLHPPSPTESVPATPAAPRTPPQSPLKKRRASEQPEVVITTSAKKGRKTSVAAKEPEVVIESPKKGRKASATAASEVRKASTASKGAKPTGVTKATPRLTKGTTAAKDVTPRSVTQTQAHKFVKFQAHYSPDTSTTTNPVLKLTGKASAPKKPSKPVPLPTPPSSSTTLPPRKNLKDKVQNGRVTKPIPKTASSSSRPPLVVNDGFFSAKQPHHPRQFPPPHRKWDKVHKVDPALGTEGYSIPCPISKTTGSHDYRADLFYNTSDNIFAVHLDQLFDSIIVFAQNYYSATYCQHTDEESTDVFGYLQYVRDSLSPEFVRYANWIADGGPTGVAGWEELFLDGELQVGLVTGIIWKALRELVFASLCFGGTDAFLEELHRAEIEQAEWDGFARTEYRGNLIQQRLANQQGGYDYPHNFDSSVDNLTANLITLLSPLQLRTVEPKWQHPGPACPDCLSKYYPAEPSMKDCPSIHDKFLRSIMSNAASLSLSMRLDPTAIYFVTNTFKDELFSLSPPSSSTNLSAPTFFTPTFGASFQSKENLPTWTSPHPSHPSLSESSVNNIKIYQPLTRIIVFDSIEVYRRGGWRGVDSEKGFRVKTLVGGRVATRWGVPQAGSPWVKAPKESVWLGLGEALKKGFGERCSWAYKKCRDPAHAIKGFPVVGLKGKRCENVG